MEAGYNPGYRLVSESKIKRKFNQAAGLLRIAISEGAQGQEELREGGIWGVLLDSEWYKSMAWGLPLPCLLPNCGVSRRC